MRVLALVVLIVLAAACGSSAATSPTSASPAPAPAARASGKASAPARPAPIGRAQSSADDQVAATVTVLHYRYPLRSDVPPDRAGYGYAGAEVKVCVTKNLLSEPVTVSWSPWSLVWGDGTVAEPPSSWSPDGFSVPLYPNNDRVVPVGRCVRGWVPFEVAEGAARPELVSYQPGSVDVLEWAIP